MIWALSYDKTENGQELIHTISGDYINTILNKSIYVPIKIISSVYPNPFNSICKVDIQIEQDQCLRISVNNLLGNQINILNNKKLSKGRYQFLWDAGDYSDGLCIIKAEHNQSFEKKITLFK